MWGIPQREEERRFRQQLMRERKNIALGRPIDRKRRKHPVSVAYWRASRQRYPLPDHLWE